MWQPTVNDPSVAVDEAQVPPEPVAEQLAAEPEEVPVDLAQIYREVSAEDAAPAKRALALRTAK